MSDRERHPAAGHKQFPYFFTEKTDGTPIEGLWLTEVPVPGPEYSISFKYDYDLAIYYNTLTGNDYVDCKCSRWDVQNYSVIIETWLKKSDFENIKTHTKPGAVGELFKILGRPLYYDKTWTGGNTLRLFPTPSSNNMNSSTLHKMRSETLIYPKNLSWGTIPGTKGWIFTKIEGLISGSVDL